MKMGIFQKEIKNETKTIRALHYKVKFFIGVFLILPLLVGIIIFSNLSTISSHIKPNEAEAAINWYNSSWNYRRSVALQGSSSGAQNNYQVKINVAYNSHMKSDFSDIRFTGADGITLLNYWRESYSNSGSAIFWVNVPSIPASPSTTNLFMYYGNGAAGTASNGENTFSFFDDFEPKSWQKINNLPAPTSDQAGAVLNGKVYTIGGYNTSYLQPVGLVWEYNPVNNTYVQKKSLNVARWGLACTGYGSNIYCFGGKNTNQSANIQTERYNPATDTWTNLSYLPAPLQSQGLAAIANGSNIFLFYNKQLYKYNPATDTYTYLSTGTQNLTNWPSMAYYNNEIYILGGYYNDGGKNYVQIYNTVNNTWRQGAPMPVGLYGTLRENPVVNGKIYILQGQGVPNRGDFFSRYWVYDIAGNSWTWGELGYWDADGVSGGVIGSKIYTFGGRRGHNADDRGTTYAGVLDTAKSVSGKWIDVNSGGWREESSALMTGLAQFNSLSQIRTASAVTNGKAKVISKMKYTETAKTGYGGLLVNSSGGLYYNTDNSYATPYLDVASNRNWLFRMTGKSLPVSTYNSPVVSADTWHNYITTFDTSKITQTIDGSSTLSINDSTYRSGYIQVFRTSANNGAGALNLTVDYVAVAKYTSPEPVPGTFGSEENSNGAISSPTPTPLLTPSYTPVPGAGLVAYWKLDNNASDSSGNGYNGIIYGATWITGKVGSALKFNGSTNYVAAGSIAPSAAGTMEAWIMPGGDYTKDQAVIAGGASNGADRLAAYQIVAHTANCPSGDWGTVLGNGTSAQSVCSGQIYNSANFPANAWTHLAITYDGANVKFYKDANLVKTVAQTIAVSVPAQSYTIGRLGAYSVYYFNGGIDEARIYNKALTGNEILADYNAR